MRAVPSNRLIWLAAIVAIPAFTVIVYDGGVWRLVGILRLLAATVLSNLDSYLSRGALAAVTCEAADLVRGTKGRDLSFPVTFSNAGGPLSEIRHSLSASTAYRINGEVIRTIPSLDSGKQISVTYPLIPLQRGRFFIESIHIETRSLLGLWLMRRGYDLNVEMRIYPDLSIERKRLSSLFLMRGLEGSHLVRQVGKGRDFEQLREYQPGDNYTDIDWKATARRQAPVTRTYQIEKTQEVYVVVDHSRLSGREIRVPVGETVGEDWDYAESSAGGEYLVTTQLEKFLHCSLVLASVAQRQGDLFGFVSFADKVDRFIRGRSGKDHYNIVRDALYTLEPERVAPDFEQLMISLRQRLTRRALIVMLVDLSDPLTAKNFFEALPVINRQHLVLVNMVRPEKSAPLFNAASIPENVDDVYDHLGGHFQWQELREIGNQLRHLGVELGIPDHEELCTETVTQYLNVKNRQLI
ncbi:MAG: DUF58 domain-containing protein [Planctomycetota bacterium]